MLYKSEDCFKSGKCHNKIDVLTSFINRVSIEKKKKKGKETS